MIDFDFRVLQYNKIEGNLNDGVKLFQKGKKLFFL